MRRALLAVPLLLVPAGCTDTDDRPTLTVLAASSLTDVFTDIAEGFEEHYDAEVEFSFGSSTTLAEQAADGAPGDILATADETSMRIAEDAGVTREVNHLASNVLVIVTPPGNPAGIESLDDLDGSTWVRCSDTAPCGRVARAVLAAHDVTAEPVSLEEDVRATLDKVVSGEADAGLVYATDAVAAGDAATRIRIPGSVNQSTSYLVAGLTQGEHPRLARQWLEWVGTEMGGEAFDEAGFYP